MSSVFRNELDNITRRYFDLINIGKSLWSSIHSTKTVECDGLVEGVGHSTKPSHVIGSATDYVVCLISLLVGGGVLSLGWTFF